MEDKRKRNVRCKSAECEFSRFSADRCDHVTTGGCLTNQGGQKVKQIYRSRGEKECVAGELLHQHVFTHTHTATHTCRVLILPKIKRSGKMSFLGIIYLSSSVKL